MENPSGSAAKTRNALEKPEERILKKLPGVWSAWGTYQTKLPAGGDFFRSRTMQNYAKKCPRVRTSKDFLAETPRVGDALKN